MAVPPRGWLASAILTVSHFYALKKLFYLFVLTAIKSCLYIWIKVTIGEYFHVSRLLFKHWSETPRWHAKKTREDKLRQRQNSHFHFNSWSPLSPNISNGSKKFQMCPIISNVSKYFTCDQIYPKLSLLCSARCTNMALLRRSPMQNQSNLKNSSLRLPERVWGKCKAKLYQGFRFHKQTPPRRQNYVCWRSKPLGWIWHIFTTLNFFGGFQVG